MEQSVGGTSPHAVPDILPPRFVGRAAELRRMISALQDPSALVLIEGDAGMGKSRLVQEALRAPGVGRRPPLVATCPPIREALTLGPVVDSVRDARPRIGDLPLTPLAGVLRPLFPEWAPDLPPAPEALSDPGASRHRLFRALAELLDVLEVGVVIVEDVHWADDATLDFLLYCASRRSRRTGLVVTYRSEEVLAESALTRLRSWSPVGGAAVRIALRALDITATAELTSSMLDDEPVSEAFAAFLRQRTDGLPLAVEESVRLLHDRADLVRRDGEWVRRTLADIVVPPTIRDAVTERAARLGPDARQVLRALAVLAEPVDIPGLTSLCELPDGPAAAAVDAAIRSGLISEDRAGRVGFRHVLASQAVYETMPVSARRQLHRGVARMLRAHSSQPVARLAHHYRRAGDTVRWREYAERTADLALATGDHPTAAGLLHDLIAEGAAPAASVARWAQKMPVLAVTGHVSRGDLVRVLREVLGGEHVSPRDRAAVRMQLGRMLIHAGDFGEAAVELEKSLPDLRGQPYQRAWVMVTLGRLPGVLLSAARQRRWLDRALAVPRERMTPDQRLSLMVDHATALLDLGDEAGWRLAARLPEAGLTHEDTPHLPRGNLNFGNAAMRWGRYGQARPLLTRALAQAEEYGHQRLHDMIAVTLAHLDWYTGDWTGLAERAADLLCLDAEPVIQLEALLVAALLDGAVGVTCPRPADDVAERLRLALEEGLRRGLLDLTPEPAGALARIRLAQGSAAEAVDVTEGPADLVARKDVWWWAAEFAPVRTGALLAVGRHDRAQRFVADFAAGVTGRNVPVAQAALETCRGRLAAGEGRFGAAATAFGRAAAWWEALPRPHEALLAAEQLSLSLLSARRNDEGEAELARVEAGFASLGAVADAVRVRRARDDAGALARSGRRVGGRRGYGDQLSPRELEVVRLVVAGLTTPAIAQTLSRSPKTVSAQLNSAMRKYGVSTRTALAVRATQEGITAADTPVPGGRSSEL